jgi:hypothetical protein
LNTNRDFLSSRPSMFYLNLFLLVHLLVQFYLFVIHLSFRFLSDRLVLVHNFHFIKHFSFLTSPIFLSTYFLRMLVILLSILLHLFDTCLSTTFHLYFFSVTLITVQTFCLGTSVFVHEKSLPFLRKRSYPFPVLPAGIITFLVHGS